MLNEQARPGNAKIKSMKKIFLAFLLVLSVNPVFSREQQSQVSVVQAARQASNEANYRNAIYQYCRAVIDVPKDQITLSEDEIIGELQQTYAKAGLPKIAKELSETKNREQFLLKQYSDTTPDLIVSESADGKSFTVINTGKSKPSFYVSTTSHKYRYSDKEAKIVLNDLWWFHPHTPKAASTK